MIGGADWLAPQTPERPMRVLTGERLRAWLAYRRILAAWRAVWGRNRAEQGNSVKLLVGGDNTFRAVERAIQSARHHIHIEMYQIEPDAVGRGFVEDLARKARQGVRVRLVYDAIGSINLPPTFFDELREAGGEVHAYHAFRTVGLSWALNRRNHRKLICIDGRVGFTGGINVSAEFAHQGVWGGAGWHDAMVQVRGPAVGQLELFFWHTWVYCHGRLPRQFNDYFPRVRSRGRAIVLARSSRRLLGRRSILNALLKAIAGARHHIHITQSYFIPTREMLKALRAASRRGVRVWLIAPGRSDVSAAHAASRYAYGRLMRGGVRVFERRGPVLHAKVVTIDGWWSLIGSSNINYRSFLMNLELSVEIRDTDLGHQLDEQFRRDLDESVPITRAWLASRTWSERFYQWLCHQLRWWM